VAPPQCDTSPFFPIQERVVLYQKFSQTLLVGKPDSKREELHYAPYATIRPEYPKVILIFPITGGSWDIKVNPLLIYYFKILLKKYI
jgi:hypothetical protein